jgi:hypothetical protein
MLIEVTDGRMAYLQEWKVGGYLTIAKYLSVCWGKIRICCNKVFRDQRGEEFPGSAGIERVEAADSK